MRYLALILLALSFAAQGGEDVVRVKNTKMKDYSVSVPTGRDWDVSKDKRSQTIVMERQDRQSGTSVSIVVIPQDTASDYFTAHEVKWLGDDVRRREHANMIALGVNTGLYALSNVEKFETVIGEKHGYAMRYDQVSGDVASHGYLFVYFPPGFEKRGTYYKFLFSQAPKPAQLNTTLFEYVIGSFELR
jgi:hypothetical protein